ncbi:MAG: hypothetical protein K2F78_09445 [Muribaculaceae bacterium]|nr:hypothetical protein [Muribaculaceae bacterium]
MMKHLFFSLIVALTLGAGSASAFDPKDLLNSLGGKSSDDGNSSSGGFILYTSPSQRDS